MTYPDKALQTLADRMRCAGTPPHRLRETLEASLLPLVRRALRSGAGMPQLVQWVQATLPHVDCGQDRTHPADPERAAPSLARLLCATLLHPESARRSALAVETVLGR